MPRCRIDVQYPPPLHDGRTTLLAAMDVMSRTSMLLIAAVPTFMSCFTPVVSFSPCNSCHDHHQPLLMHPPAGGAAAAGHQLALLWRLRRPRNTRSCRHRHNTRRNTCMLRMAASDSCQCAASVLGNIDQQQQQDVLVLSVINPLTNRRIRRRKLPSAAAAEPKSSIDASPNKGSSKSNKWYQFMCQNGGYIAHGNRLVRLNMTSLSAWNNMDVAVGSSIGENNDINGASEANAKPEATEWEEDCYITEPEVMSTYNYFDRQSSTFFVQDNDDDAETPLMAKAEDVPFINEMLFVYKPSGLLTLPGIGPDKAHCLAARVNAWLDETEEGRLRRRHIGNSENSTGRRNSKKKQTRRKKKNGASRPYVPRPCHRLDYDTSGVIAVALTPDAQRCGQMLFQERHTEKTYIALVAGHMEQDVGTVEYAIGKIMTEDGYNKWACELPLSQKEGDESSIVEFLEGSLRHSKTQWKVSARLTVPINDDLVAKYTRVELVPVTGRGHQLRLHMAAIGHPILGDELHAPQEVADAAPRLCLHAETLVLPVAKAEDEEGKYVSVFASASYPAPF